MFRAILLIIRRLNCINTASGVVTLRRWPYGAQVGRELRILSVLGYYDPHHACPSYSQSVGPRELIVLSFAKFCDTSNSKLNVLIHSTFSSNRTQTTGTLHEGWRDSSSQFEGPAFLARR
jgi:hypothetical protein